MAADLKNRGKGNLVVVGEPDLDEVCGRTRVKIDGVDVFHPVTGEIRSDGIACWFVDADYDEESFFVRHAYFLGAGNPHKALQTTLKAEITDATLGRRFTATPCARSPCPPRGASRSTSSTPSATRS